MTAIDLLRVTAVAAVAAVLLAQSAAAGGEPKNEWPFTRPVPARVQSAAAHRAESTDVHGEAKNGWPFARRVDERSRQGTTRAIVFDSSPRGEAKNEPPFVQPVVSSTSSAEAFDWTDGAIGVLAGIGLAVSVAGVLLLARKSPQTA